MLMRIFSAWEGFTDNLLVLPPTGMQMSRPYSGEVPFIGIGNHEEEKMVNYIV